MKNIAADWENMDKGIQYVSLGERTYQEIKKLIVSGQIQSGERLRYKDLVERLNVSQTPIKEAFTRLENEGLVVTIPHRGTIVKELSIKDIREMFQIREMLESLAARLAACNANAKEIEQLRRINQKFSDAAANKNVKSCTEEDYRFHELLYKIAANDRLIRLMNYSNIHLLSIAQTSSNFLEISAVYKQHHTDIVAAIADHDQSSAESLMRNHLQYAKEQVIQFIKKTDIGENLLG